MLVELRVGEQRYRAVWEVLDGASVTQVVNHPDFGGGIDLTKGWSHVSTEEVSA